MSLKARLDDRDIISVLCSDEDWSEAQRASKGNGHRVRMSCCGAPAYASHSPLDLRYFAHKPGFERCSAGGESDEHECLKAAAARAVQSCASWAADVEVSGEGWRADVLAIRGSVKIAIEVQLSAQAKRETGARNDRFEASEVTPFWLKGHANHVNDFGDGLQAPVNGDGIREQMASVRLAVCDLLGKVKCQVEIANALARLIRSIPGWTYQIERQGTIPACFELRRDDKIQQILLGELGPSLLPTIFRPVDGKQIGADQFAGAVLQVRVDASHLRGYQSSSFQLDRGNIAGSLDRKLRPVLEGKTKWQGKEHTEIVPGAFVHYLEECASCGTRFLRITHLLIGHPRHPTALPCKVVRDDWGRHEALLAHAEALSERTGLILGPLKGDRSNGFSPTIPTRQTCPQCHATAPEALISDDEALQYWPGSDEHFRFRLPSPGKGWGASTSWTQRPLGGADAWESMLAQKQVEREHDRNEERMRQELATAERKRQREEWQRQAEERRLRQVAEEEARKAEQLRRSADDKRRAEEERLAKVEADRVSRRGELTKAAERIIIDGPRRELWLTTGNPKLRPSLGMAAPHPIELAAESKEGLEKALALLRSIKF